MATGTIPAHTPPTDAPPDEGELFSAVIPQEFHDRPYLKDILAMKKSPEAYTALLKKLDGAEKLVGKKTGIPDAAAPAEEWDQFFTKFRPETEEAYEIRAEEGKEANPEMAKALKGIFFKAGLNKIQAAKMQEHFGAFVTGQRAEQVKAQQKLDAEFDEISKATFGAENTKALERAKTMLGELTPANLKPHLEKLPNESLVVLAGVLNAVHAKYLTEDNVDANGKGSGANDNALQEEGLKLLASPEYRDTFHPKHAQVKARVNQVYAELGKKRA